jgi:ComEC/Rec2-related protein
MKNLKEHRNPVIETVQKHYYILWTISFGSGIYAGKRIAFIIKMPQYFYYVAIIFMFAFLLVSLCCYLKAASGRMQEKIIFFPLFLVPVIILFLAGFLQSCQQSGYQDAMQNTGTSGMPVTVYIKGRVADHPVALYGNTYFDMRIKELRYIQYSAPEDGRNGASNFTATVRLESFNEMGISRDDLLEARGRLYSSGDKIFIKSCSSNVNFLENESPHEILWQLRQKVYRCIKLTFDRYLDYGEAHLAEALILGNRNGISDYLYDAFKKSGTAHLIAISGMHISFLALIIYMVAGGRIGKPAAAALIIIILLLYNFILGSKASVQRATIWAICAVISEVWHRENAAPGILCMSFIIMLVINPGFSDDAGFWLSFSAMAGMVFVYPVLRKISGLFKMTKKAADNYFTRIVVATISIQMACGPLILYYFGSLPIISPISNVFILPFFYILISMLFLSAFLSIIWPPAGGVVLKSTPFLFDIVTGIAEFFSGSWSPSVKAGGISVLQMSGYYLLLFAGAIAAGALIDKKFDFYR